MPEPSSPPIDSALQAFRQQGAAMVARERGLTASCRVKLSGLARSLGIADDQIDAAIRSLGASEPAAPPNPLAEKLRDRLRKDLQGRKAIIGPTIEAQIVAAAAKKYALDEATTRQVIGEVAAELNLKRISASDALRNLTDQIDRAVGRSTWLAREGWDRLRVAGGKWGIDLDVVDELIDERLAANRQQRSMRQTWLRLTIGGSVIAVALAGALGVIVSLGRQENPPADSAGTTQPAAPTETAARLPDRSAPPAWWDVDLAVDMAGAKSRHGGMAGACDLMASPAAEERAAGYERIIEHLRQSSLRGDLSITAGNIVSGSHALEPDEAAAARLRRAVLGLLPASDAPVPADREQLDLPFWAADTAVAALHRRGLSTARRQALADELSAALQFSFDPAASLDEHRQLARSRTALAAYRQFTTAAASQGAEVARLQEALRERVEAWLPEEELARAEATLLAAALPTAGEHWPAYELALIRVVRGDEPLNLLKLVDALRRVEDPELVEILSGLLLVKTGANPATASKEDVIRAVRKVIGQTNPEAITAADRWLTLEQAAAAALSATDSPTTDTKELLRQSIELAHLTTLAMALSQGEVGFAAFDAGIDDPPQLERPASAAADDAAEEDGAASALPRPARSLNVTDRRLFQRYLDLLTTQGRNQQVQRASALRGLANFATGLPEITQEQAAPLAGYLLNRKNDDEFAGTLPPLAELRRWKRLRLAVADGLSDARLPLEKQRELVAALTQQRVADDASADVLRRMLLESVLSELAVASDVRPAARGEAALFDAAAEALRETYLRRARLLGVSAGDSGGAATPSQALELCLNTLASSSPKSAGGEPAASWTHRLQAARYVGGDDLRQTVALQRLLVEVSAQRAIKFRPQHAATARQIETEALAAGNTAADHVLHQLRSQEALLLKLWMLYAVET